MKFQHAYSEPSRAGDIDCKDPSLSQQSWKDEVDINVILEKYRVTGVLPSGVRMPSYGDFTGISDYRSAMNVLLQAQDAFAAMPADVRARFGNDPGLFIEFMSKPENREEAERLGLVIAKQKDVGDTTNADSVLAAKPGSASQPAT